jgi:hypothetical protein
MKWVVRIVVILVLALAYFFGYVVGKTAER